jgi:hypothetical protein
MFILSSARSRLIYPTLTAAFILAAFYSVSAQPPAPVEASIKLITANHIKNESQIVKGWALFVRFSTEFNTNNPVDRAKATNPSNYKIINVNTGAWVPVSEAQFVIEAGNSTPYVRLVAPSADALNTTDFFHLYAINLAFDGAPPKEALQHPIKIEVETAAAAPNEGPTVVVDNNDKTPGINPHAEPKPAWGLKESKNRDDSDIYAAWELTSARDTATTGTGDVKVAIPFFKNFWKRTSRFSPLVEIKASSNHKADADSLKFALEWYLPLYRNIHAKKFPYAAVHLINTGKIEAPKNFDNVNAIWEGRWLFPSAQFPGISERFDVYLDPFVGHELGKNLRSPLPEADGKGIARVYAGANFVVDIPVKNVTGFKGVLFDASYIRRWPLKRELTIEDAGNGKINLLTFGKGPKEYVTSKFTVKVNEYFGPYVGYEWGSLPPVYKFVDHKWTFGLLFKSKIRVK